MKHLKPSFFVLLFIAVTECFACTIFSARDRKGEVWVGNNEDNTFSFYNYINVFPKIGNARYGYYTLSYHSPENGENFNIQGGMNEAGLFYDFNTLTEGSEEYLISDLHKKQSFPGGDQAILSHILANFSTVKEVLDFFDTYWFDIGFKGAQMHLADRNGNFAMIDPTGSRLLKDAPYQLSTNFSICAQEDPGSCWRFPIAKNILEDQAPSFSTFKQICKETAQKGANATIYSNIQNLSTGAISFFFGLDYENEYTTNIATLLGAGRKSYLIKDLFPHHPLTMVYGTYQESGATKALELLNTFSLTDEVKNTFLAAFVNNQIGKSFDMKAIPFLEAYLKTDPIGHWMTGATAITYYNNGNVDKAVNTVKAYKSKYPETSMDVSYMLDRFKGAFPKDYNTEITLNGHPAATHVFVKGLPGGIYNFMARTAGGWTFKKFLPEGVYHYTFVVDGKEVLDPKTKIFVDDNPFSQNEQKSHRIAQGATIKAYETTIKIKVPNITDEVYITGNQNNLANWNSVLRMDRISDFERRLTVKLHYPAMIKFTRGNWSTEALVKGYPKEEERNAYPPIVLKTRMENAQFDIVNWKDRL